MHFIIDYELFASIECKYMVGIQWCYGTSTKNL